MLLATDLTILSVFIELPKLVS